MKLVCLIIICALLAGCVTWGDENNGGSFSIYDTGKEVKR